MTLSKKFLPIALVVSALVPTIATTGSASAALKNPQADQAMRKGIRDVARLNQAGPATAKNIKISCVAVPQVNEKKPCSGSFDLTYGGKTAHYTLTSKARTFRLSPGAIEYRVSAHAAKKVQGLPGRTDLLGVLQ